MKRTLLVWLVVIGCVLAGCSSSSKSSNPKIELTDARGKTSVAVTVKDNVFEPRGIRIDPGTRVTFVNDGRSAHNILLSDPNLAYDTALGVNADKFAAGSSYSYTFTKSGVFPIYCSLHGTPTAGMIGVVVVGDVPFDGHIGAVQSTGTKSGTFRVPADYPTIQAAVNAAKPGSLVLVASGVYREAVTVSNPRIVIRGEERAGTILDGEFTRDNGFKVIADGVAIENMTARNYTKNGFFWTGIKGYRGSYLTAIRNGDYGIYAFDAVNGQFDHDYGAGSPDAGFYIGQCYPCNTVITDSIAEWNGIGYSGTNAGGNLLIVNSIWRHNRVGIVPNSGTEEANPPERETTIVGNIVYDNNNAKSAAIDIAQTAIGNGILLAGGIDNTVERNLVYDHDIAGIGVITLPEKVLSPDDKKAQNFDARRNTVRENVTQRQPCRRSSARDDHRGPEGRRRELLLREHLPHIFASEARAAGAVRVATLAVVHRRHPPVRGGVHRREAEGRGLQGRPPAGATGARRHAERDERPGARGRRERADAHRPLHDPRPREVSEPRTALSLRCRSRRGRSRRLDAPSPASRASQAGSGAPPDPKTT